METETFNIGDVVRGRFNSAHKRGIILQVRGNLIQVKWDGMEFHSWMVASDCIKLDSTQ